MVTKLYLQYVEFAYSVKWPDLFQKYLFYFDKLRLHFKIRNVSVRNSSHTHAVEESCEKKL